MDLLANAIYLDDLRRINEVSFIPWDNLRGSSILLSGATGMIGKCLVDSIMLRNREQGFGCSIFAIGRNPEKAEQRFESWWETPLFHFIKGDVNDPSTFHIDQSIDYVIHLASNTHPVAYATDPIGTITANIIGTKTLLDLAVRCKAKRFVFASSNEIYGENRGDQELFDESYLGYIDCNTLRAGYPESKRCGEALCQAYKKQTGLDIVITRLTRSFGPTLLNTDTKALSQFLKNGIHHENIVLKSVGNQYYSYTYTDDAVTGLLTSMLKGENGEAYNIADESYDIRLKDLAQIIADIANVQVIFELPNQIESAGFSKATKARLSGRKIRDLGWKPLMPLNQALIRTMQVRMDQ